MRLRSGNRGVVCTGGFSVLSVTTSESLFACQLLVVDSEREGAPALYCLSGCIHVYIYMKYIYIELLLFISLKVSSNVLWMVKWWVPRQSAIIGPNSVAISRNLTPNHRKIPINSGKSGLVKSYPPTLRKVMQDAIQREDLAAGPGVELEKMGNCWILVGGEVWYSIFVWSQMVSQGWNDSKSIIWIRKAAFCFGGKLAVHTGDIYIYMALKEVNRKYKHAFWCWWLVFLIAKI